MFVAAVEKLLELEVPPKATWMRTLLCELNRIHSHLVWLGTSALELGAISMFWYAFREREQILDLFELVTGYRMHTRYFQVGGLAEDIPRGFYPEARKFCDWMPKAIDDYETLLDAQQDLARAHRGHRAPVGRRRDRARPVRARCCARRASTGTCAASEPYLAYHQVDFRVPVYPEGDVYARYRVHMEEMRESVRIVEQCLDRLEQHGGRAVDRRRPQGRAAAARTSCTPRWSR